MTRLPWSLAMISTLPFWEYGHARVRRAQVNTDYRTGGLAGGTWLVRPSALEQARERESGRKKSSHSMGLVAARRRIAELVA